TTFSRRNINEIDSIVALMEKLKITLWSVFFLVPTGRGKLNDLLNPEEFESAFAKVYRLSKTASFDIKTTEAQHYRRYLLQQRAAERKSGIDVASQNGRVVDVIGRAPRSQRRERLCLHLAQRRSLPERFSSSGGRKCSRAGIVHDLS
ncbi:MAG: hypothetical protein WAL75_15335, partial [Terracidiphilus sp.]